MGDLLEKGRGAVIVAIDPVANERGVQKRRMIALHVSWALTWRQVDHLADRHDVWLCSCRAHLLSISSTHTGFPRGMSCLEPNLVTAIKPFRLLCYLLLCVWSQPTRTLDSHLQQEPRITAK